MMPINSDNSDNQEIARLRAEVRQLRGLLAEQERTEHVLTTTERRVTEQTRELASTREELAQQARLFDTVLSSIVDFAYTFNREGRFTYINQALLDLWQMTLAEARGKNFFELNYPPDLAARLQQQIETVFRTGQTICDETPYTGAAGKNSYYEYIFVPVFGKDGQVEVVTGSTRDITHRMRIQEEKETLLQTLEVERERLVSLFMQAPAFIAVLRGPTHIFEMANPPYFQLVGHRDLLGKPVREVFPEIEGQGFFEWLDGVYGTGKPFVGKETRILLQDTADALPRERFIDFVYQPLVEADGTVSGIFVHGVDLTERKRAEEALQERAQEIDALNMRLKRAMTETHHRVKNNLQVISAMIEMQVMEHEGEPTLPVEEFTRLKTHVFTLAVVHDVLTQNVKETDDAQNVSTRDVLEHLLPMLQHTAGQKTVRYEIEDAELTAKQCIALSLVLNELVSNALKHGKKEAILSFTVQEGEAALIIQDDGPGFPEGFDSQRAANTGLELVENFVKFDLAGQLRYQNRAQGGGEVRIVFPLLSQEG